MGGERQLTGSSPRRPGPGHRREGLCGRAGLPTALEDTRQARRPPPLPRDPGEGARGWGASVSWGQSLVRDVGKLWGRRW